MSRTSDPNYVRARRKLKRSADSDVCFWCHGFIPDDAIWPDPMSWTADHLVQIMDGGRNDGLLVPAHWKCNLDRRYKNPPHPDTPDPGS